MRHTGGSPLYGRFLCYILNREATGTSSSPGDSIFSALSVLIDPSLLVCRDALSAWPGIPDRLDSSRKGKRAGSQVMRFRAGRLDYAVRKDLLHELQTVRPGDVTPEERGRGEGNLPGDRRRHARADRRSVAICFLLPSLSEMCSNAEGTGSDNGVEHAHLLVKCNWYAYYEVIQPTFSLPECRTDGLSQCCVHRSLLENPKSLFSKSFVVDDRTW